jgi:hypothetical protein
MAKLTPLCRNYAQTQKELKSPARNLRPGICQKAEPAGLSHLTSLLDLEFTDRAPALIRADCDRIGVRRHDTFAPVAPGAFFLGAQA